MHFNENSQRKQAKTNSGKERWVVIYPKVHQGEKAIARKKKRKRHIVSVIHQYNTILDTQYFILPRHSFFGSYLQANQCSVPEEMIADIFSIIWWLRYQSTFWKAILIMNLLLLLFRIYRSHSAWKSQIANQIQDHKESKRTSLTKIFYRIFHRIFSGILYRIFYEKLEHILWDILWNNL